MNLLPIITYVGKDFEILTGCKNVDYPWCYKITNLMDQKKDFWVIRPEQVNSDLTSSLLVGGVGGERKASETKVILISSQ